MTKTAISVALVTLRSMTRLSSRDAAALAGTSHTYLERVEQAGVTPSPAWVRRVTRALAEHIDTIDRSSTP